MGWENNPGIPARVIGRDFGRFGKGLVISSSQGLPQISTGFMFQIKFLAEDERNRKVLPWRQK